MSSTLSSQLGKKTLEIVRVNWSDGECNPLSIYITFTQAVLDESSANLDSCPLLELGIKPCKGIKRMRYRDSLRMLLWLSSQADYEDQSAFLVRFIACLYLIKIISWNVCMFNMKMGYNDESRTCFFRISDWLSWCCLFAARSHIRFWLLSAWLPFLQATHGELPLGHPQRHG